LGFLGGEKATVEAVGAVKMDGEIEGGGFLEDRDNVMFGAGEEGVVHEGDIEGVMGLEQGQQAS